jgi:2-polyprenyl-6-methoxyphenol hydroxylase-like FAD-dependent oxidoreductase
LARPHQQLTQLDAWIGDHRATIADFSHLPTRCKFIAFMPQWDFLNFLAEKARRYETFRLRMRAEVTDLIRTGDAVTGVTAKTPDGELHVRAKLVVGCDGRGSIVRAQAGLEVIDVGAPMDVLWMRLSRGPDDPLHTLGRISRGHMLALIDRGDYWQCGFVIPKGSLDDWRRRGLPAFRDELRRTAPFFGDRVEELRSWDDVKLLTVRVDRLRVWHRAGLLCIGDSAHAMSPVGGVGINPAIQDAVATANRLVEPLADGTLDQRDLAAIQRRRTMPTRRTQRLQVLIQNRVIRRILAGDEADVKPMSLPLMVRLLQVCPRMRRLPARVMGMGFLPEHVHTPERAPRR